MPTQQDKPDILKPGEIVGKTYKVQEKIGMGGFGQIYSVADRKTGNIYAMKVESLSGDNAGKQVMRMEQAVMKRLRNCPHVCTLVQWGMKPRCYSFFVMTLCGSNLAELRRKSPYRCFTMGTTFRLALQMLEAIQEVHAGGFLHRDVKPSNFAMGKEQGKDKSADKRERQKVYILDFGLARPFVINGEVRRERPQGEAGFRGTVRYASLTTHHRKDMGRGDDLWSLFYVLIEFLQGLLPWSRESDKEETQKLKEKYTPERLVEGQTPAVKKALLAFSTHLKAVGYTDEPDYAKLRGLLTTVLEGQKIDMNGPLDWEEDWKTLEATAAAEAASTNAASASAIERKASKSRATDIEILREGKESDWEVYGEE